MQGRTEMATPNPGLELASQKANDAAVAASGAPGPELLLVLR